MGRLAQRTPPQGSQHDRMANGPPHPKLGYQYKSFWVSERLENTRGKLACNVSATHGKYKRQSGRADETRPQAHREEEAQAGSPVPEGLQPHDCGNRHGKDPQVGDNVCNVGEEGNGNLVDAGPALDGSPPGLDGAAAGKHDNLHDEDPGDDEGRSADDERPEEGRLEYAVVEGEDGEFRAGNGEVVEVAEDVVALDESVEN